MSTIVAADKSEPGVNRVAWATQQLKAMLRQPPYAGGARLPSERDLATQLDVNRGTIREAIRSLVHQGFLETKRGAGTRVRQETAGLLQAPFEAWLRHGDVPVSDFFDVRELIEIHAATLAAKRRTEADIDRIRATLPGLRPGVDREAQNQANVEFHTAVAEASGNLVLAELIRSLAHGIRYTVEESQDRIVDPVASYQVHADISDAIAAGDVVGARTAMADHMRIARREWLP